MRHLYDSLRTCAKEEEVKAVEARRAIGQEALDDKGRRAIAGVGQDACPDIDGCPVGAVDAGLEEP